MSSMKIFLFCDYKQYFQIHEFKKRDPKLDPWTTSIFNKLRFDFDPSQIIQCDTRQDNK